MGSGYNGETIGIVHISKELGYEKKGKISTVIRIITSGQEIRRIFIARLWVKEIISLRWEFKGLWLENDLDDLSFTETLPLTWKVTWHYIGSRGTYWEGHMCKYLFNIQDFLGKSVVRRSEWSELNTQSARQAESRAPSSRCVCAIVKRVCTFPLG